MKLINIPRYYCIKHVLVNDAINVALIVVSRDVFDKAVYKLWDDTPVDGMLLLRHETELETQNIISQLREEFRR